MSVLITPADRIKDPQTDFLLQCILALDSMEECYAFFEDLCTVPEIKSMARRVAVAKMLKDNKKYDEIVKITGASTATISRVNRSLSYGKGGYDIVFGRVEEK